MARAADFDLAKELGKPSFTPAQRDAPGLVELVVAGEEPAAGRAAAALAGLGEVGRRALEARLAGHALAETPAEVREDDTAELGEGAIARLVGALGLLARAGDATARAALLARVHDPGVRVRRAAIAALGKLGGDDARAALLAHWDSAVTMPPDERRTLVEALGKLGGAEVQARLTALVPGDDAELARRRDRALLMVDRDAKRGETSAIVTTVPLPFAVRLSCKPGLGPLLAEEVGVRAGTDAWVETRVATWQDVYRFRLWSSAGIRVPMRGSIVDTIVSVRDLLRAMTRGPIRWRLGFPSGHRRATVWQVARDVAARAPELVNDPTDTTWDVLVDDGALELTPRRADDPRFAWRVAEVPAASHPSVAAALAFAAGARAGDRVWDPFCGSGAELVERARLGPCTLLGTDISDDALAAARRNLAAANVTATVVLADARTHAPQPVDLVVTNPPLGSRVQVDAAALLVAALPNLAHALAPGGRLVWITPAAKRTGPVAERLGLRRTRDLAVDLGGVRGRLERWER
jgi:SAM-dependent methyltransferase